MENIQFDSGVKCYRINGGGTLRFHPGDPNLYSRFLEAVEKFKALEQRFGEMSRQEDLLGCMTAADREMKQILGWVFGEENDFNALLGGVNLLAVADNGERIITNLLLALEPVLVDGAKRCAQLKTEEARKKAEERRQQQ